jgi:pimeloyl-ACP methyl ester carboxylesterase
MIKNKIMSRSPIVKTRIIVSVLLVIFSVSLTIAQNNGEKLTGIWEGKLAIQGVQLRIVFNLEMKDGKLTGTLDSPDQGAKGIPVTDITFNGDSLTLKVASVNGYFTGVPDADYQKIPGKWFQGGMSLPLELKRTDKVEEVKRPQTPSEPFPYKIEQVNFQNKQAAISLAGTLTIPEGSGSFPVVIMITGSGPQDRDESLLNHKPFWVIADRFSRNGIAVLRYDDRGTAESGGDFAAATTVDFAEDVNAAVEYLMTREEFKNSKIGLLGHSEGGLIAPIVSVNNPEVDYIILLAGPAINGEEILKVQSRLIAKAEGGDDAAIERDEIFSGKIYNVLKTETDTTVIKEKITVLFKEYYESLSPEEKQKAGESVDVLLQQNLRMINSPWFKYFLTYDPRPVLDKVTIPALALYGEKDLQVPPKENIPEMEKALGKNGNKFSKVMEFDGLNHLFQHAVTGSPTEYATIEETFSYDVIDVMVNWVNTLK